MTAESGQVQVLYTLWTTDAQNDDPRQQGEVMAFLAAHDIEQGALIIGNIIDVVQTGGGELRMRTWRIPRSDMPGKDCPHCPGCVKQMPVDVPLAAHPPLDVAPAHRYPGFDEAMAAAGFDVK